MRKDTLLKTIILKRILPKEYQKYDVLFYEEGILGGYCNDNLFESFFNERNNYLEQRIKVEIRKFKLEIMENNMQKAKTPKGD